jgi:hypothetical protein
LVDTLRGGAGPPTGLDAEILRLSTNGGALRSVESALDLGVPALGSGRRRRLPHRRLAGAPGGTRMDADPGAGPGDRDGPGQCPSPRQGAVDTGADRRRAVHPPSPGDVGGSSPRWRRHSPPPPQPRCRWRPTPRRGWPALPNW